MGKQALFQDEPALARPDQGLADLRVNQEYAARFQHNKEREELHRLQAKGLAAAGPVKRRAAAAAAAADGGASGSEDASSASSISSSDDEAEDADPALRMDDAFLHALARIRQRDAALYDKSTRLFGDSSSGGEEEEEGEEEGEAEKAGSPGGARHRKRPVYLKDVLAAQALEGEGEGAEGEEEAGHTTQRRGLAYDQEQEDLRRHFLQVADAPASEEEEEEGDEEEAQDAEGDFRGVLKRRGAVPAAAAQPGATSDRQALLDQAFGPSEADAFLRDFVAREAWRGGGGEDGAGAGSESPQGVGENLDLEEDEEHLEAAERFEAGYNFRFQEAGGAQLVTHARAVPGALRRPDTRRAEARVGRAARKAERAAVEEQEALRLRALQRKELERQVAQAAKEAGAAAPGGALAQLLEQEEFNPALYDRAMREGFDEGYYEAEEGEPPAAEPPSPPASDAGMVSAGDATDSTADSAEVSSEERESGDGDEEGEGSTEGEPPSAAAGDLSAAPAEPGQGGLKLNALLGQLRTLQEGGGRGAAKRQRFRYRQVEPADQGLSVEEILCLPDKELNQVVGFKKLAAYRTDRARPNYGKARELRAGLREEQRGGPSAKKKKKEKGSQGRRAGQPALAMDVDEPIYAPGLDMEPGSLLKPFREEAEIQSEPRGSQGPEEEPMASAPPVAEGSAAQQQPKRKRVRLPEKAGGCVEAAGGGKAAAAEGPAGLGIPRDRKRKAQGEGVAPGRPPSKGALDRAAAGPMRQAGGEGVPPGVPPGAKRRRREQAAAAAAAASHPPDAAGLPDAAVPAATPQEPGLATERERRRALKSREAEARRVRLREASFRKPRLPSQKDLPAELQRKKKQRKKGTGGGEGPGPGAGAGGEAGDKGGASGAGGGGGGDQPSSGLTKAQRKNMARSRRKARLRKESAP